MKQDAQVQCTRMTLRDGIGREVGRGSRYGTHVHLWLIHVIVWQKPPQYCKVISLQFKEIIFLEKGLRKNNNKEMEKLENIN